MADTFRCWKCQGVFKKVRSDAEAIAEYEARFGRHMGEEIGVLCEKCQEEFETWLAAHKKGLGM